MILTKVVKENNFQKTLVQNNGLFYKFTYTYFTLILELYLEIMAL